jgi:ketopantoate reductase
MKSLIVGAGAIGQVYAYSLKKAGHQVFYYVKEKYREEVQGDQLLYPLNRRDPRREALTFKVDGVITTPAEVANTTWDQIYLCMSSTGLRGPWLQEFALSVKDATLIGLQSGAKDRAYLLQYFRPEQIVMGMLSVISYHAPLPGEKVPGPGTAYWFPTFGPSPFSGSAQRVADVVKDLNRGGYPAKIVADVSPLVAHPSGVLMCLISGLELSDWSFKKFSDGPEIDLVSRAVKELIAMIEKTEGHKAPWPLKNCFGPNFVRTLMKVSPLVIPMDIETYLKVHFTKVGDQTRLYMQEYVNSALESKQSCPSLIELTKNLIALG